MATDIYSIDKINDNVWKYVILNSKQFNWNFLAVKLSLTRLNLRIELEPNNPRVLYETCEELKDLFKRSLRVPNAQKDFETIVELSLSKKDF